MESTHVDRGRWGEEIAAAYLRLEGYRILCRNFRHSRMEIDILAGKDRVLAVVEVKYRRGTGWGGAVGAVSRQKQRDIETAAVGYLKVTGTAGVRVRFDVVALEPLERGRGLAVRHFPGAFSATGRYRL